ncbi:MAG: hypothetical protein Q9227_006822 [Pyrenula ochraceoflavens]
MEDPPPYHPKDAVSKSLESSAVIGAAGLLVAGTQNTLARQNLPVMSIFTRTGGFIGLCAASGAAYGFVSNASANLREKDDPYNKALGGFFAGSIAGIARGSMTSTLGTGAALAAAIGVFEYAGGSLLPGKDPEVDDYDRKEMLKQRRRRPYQETINELGEGRGIYGPGYEERRRQRIKQAYGIDVPPPFYKSTTSSSSS